MHFHFIDVLLFRKQRRFIATRSYSKLCSSCIVKSGNEVSRCCFIFNIFICTLIYSGCFVLFYHSPKLAACAADLSFPSSALGLGAVCHLITSAVAFWPVFGWAPNLFHRLLENVTAKLPVGPKDASSMLSLLVCFSHELLSLLLYISFFSWMIRCCFLTVIFCIERVTYFQMKVYGNGEARFLH